MNDQVDSNNIGLSKSDDSSSNSLPYSGKTSESVPNFGSTDEDHDFRNGTNLDGEQAIDKAGGFGRF